ncbi:MAG TPA: signal peptide peptidase SppA [Bacteroidales bacterium]|nr:signal peptide peptidase SppA [Bacteroidales bacterium]
MKEFLKYTLATITGIIIASLLFFVIMLATVSAIVASGDKPASISNNSILVLKAGVPIPDRGNPNPFAGFDVVNMTLTPTPGLNEILKNIEKASSDNKIKGILIENGLLNSGWATTEEIRNALKEFRGTGKFVISYTDYILNQECYYLSTAADKIYINPVAMVEFKGLSSEVVFFKDALDKLGVDVQVIRHGKFKGAVEPFMLNKLSEENKEQIKDYAGSIWNHVIENISESRNIPASELNRIADKLESTVASQALASGLIDGLVYKDVLIDTLKSLSGIDKDKDLNLVSMTKYSKVPDPKKNYSAKSRIAVVYAEGTIVMGKGGENNIGGDTYAEVIRKERRDSSVKAIVLRVNSPGGNAMASDVMWRELELAAQVKPVVVSMGNYAASGGYYISAPGTKIYANPTTISGSIGVFGLIPNAGSLLEDKLGLKMDIVKTNENADFPSITRPMSSYEKEVMQMSIEKTYGDFVNKVASGRKMKESVVDSIGQGRVWSGTSAIKIGLVDEFGGLKASIKGAAELAGITDYSIRELPELEDPYVKLLSQLGGDIRMNLIKKELGGSGKYLNMIEELKNMSGIQTRLPYFIEIH